MKLKLRTHLFLCIALLCLIVVLLISVFSNMLINEKFEDYVQQQQMLKIQRMKKDVTQQYDVEKNKWNTEYLHALGMNGLQDGYILQIKGADGIAVWDAKTHDMAQCDEVMDEIEARMEEKKPTLHGEIQTTDFILKQGSQQIGTLEVQYFGPYFLSESDFSFLAYLNQILLGITFISLLASFLVSYILAKRFSKPITQTMKDVETIAEGNYKMHTTTPVKIKELDALLQTTNKLACTLDHQEQLRKQLSADVAHELRTPLTTLSTHLEAMISGLWEVSEQRLQDCYEESQRLIQLVANLERLTEIESQADKLVLESFLLRDVIERVLNMQELQLREKHMTAMIHGEPIFIKADQQKMIQVMTNLMSNAIKYGDEESTIHIYIKKEKKIISLQVQNFGEIIPASQIPFVFERFYRVDASRDRKSGGNGIGLAIVKSLATAHGGKVNISSDSENGTIITLQFFQK